MASLRLIVFGGRDYTDVQAVYGALNRIVAERYLGCMTVVHGDCRGADRLASDWAISERRLRYVLEEPWPANFAVLGKRAGPIRNQAMVDAGATGAVGFPGGRGTKDMATRCKAAGIAVWWPQAGNPL